MEATFDSVEFGAGDFGFGKRLIEGQDFRARGGSGGVVVEDKIEGAELGREVGADEVA